MTTETKTPTNWSGEQQAIFGWFETSTVPESTAPVQNLIVRARAGTGKTTTIIEGINRAPESNILLAAFNKRIAVELQSKITNPNAQAKTLHAVGLLCCFKGWPGVRIAEGMDRAKNLTDRVCGATVPFEIKQLITKLHSKGREIAPHARVLGDLTDVAEQFDCVPDGGWDFDADFVETKALAAMELAATERPTVTGIDFSDMIFLPVRNRWMKKVYDLVVVDEAQDMTVAQLELARGVCSGRVCVVGDDRQAIYGFRGADSGSLDRLKTELNAAELGLTTTYRCGQIIVREAQRLVPDFNAASTNPEGKINAVVANKLIETVSHGDFILSRTNAPLVGYAMSLLRNGRRARIAGRDIGKGLQTLVKKLNARSVNDFLTKLARWTDKEIKRATSAIEDEAKLELKVEQIRDQAETLRTIGESATSVNDILARLEALFVDDGLGVQGIVTLSSVHRAKGLEADRVFVLKATLYPGKRQNREEENIEYVAITRAKKTLTWVIDPMQA